MDVVYTNIKNRRKELHMSQEELAKKCGYSGRSTISAIESGNSDLSLDKLNVIARALDTTPDILMGITDPMFDRRKDIEYPRDTRVEKAIRLNYYVKMLEILTDKSEGPVDIDKLVDIASKYINASAKERRLIDQILEDEEEN